VLLIPLWVAAATSAVMLLMLYAAGDLHARGGAIAVGWFVLAASCQFAGDSPIVVTLGLVLQTILAVALITRWRLGAS